MPVNNSELTEWETRKNIIDKELKKQWNFDYVKEEINSVKSNFKTKDYKMREDVKRLRVNLNKRVLIHI